MSIPTLLMRQLQRNVDDAHEQVRIIKRPRILRAVFNRFAENRQDEGAEPSATSTSLFPS